MNRLDPDLARAYWSASCRARAGAATEDDLTVLAAIVRAPSLPERLCDGAADAMGAALDARGDNLRGRLVEALS